MAVKIEPTLEGATIITQPMLRNFSTGGGHGPGDTLVEGDGKIVTKKWQGFPPVDLAMIGKPQPPLRQVVEPRYRGTALYATRVRLPNMLYTKFLRCPYPHAAIRRLDASAAEKMPGVHHILTWRNAPKTNPMRTELMLQGEVVAIVAAETEDQAEDAVEAIEIDYADLPSIATVAAAEAADAPDLREGKGNLLQLPANHPNYHPHASAAWRHGNVETGFAESDIVREFSYYFGGGRVVPMQPFSAVAHWEDGKLTFWGHGQDIYPTRRVLAGFLGIPEANVRYIDKWNGCTFGGMSVRAPFWGHVAHIARVTGRPVKTMLTKAEELVSVNHKPETIAKFKAGLSKDGKIHALRHELHLIAGAVDSLPIQVMSEVAKNNLELYTARTPHWEQISYAYKSNTAAVGCARSCTQQEIKWGFEVLADELAELAGLDPVEFRLRNVARPGDRLFPATDWHGELKKPELENGALTYDCFASVEVLEEGAKLFAWTKRNPKPGSMPGRFKRGMGLGMSQHHAGQLAYHEEETPFRTDRSPIFGADVEMDATGQVILRSALPDSGTNHDTGMAVVIAEMLGISDIDSIKLLWGDSDVAPPTDQWNAGKTLTVQGGAALIAAKKLRTELIDRAARKLGVESATLNLKDGVVRSRTDPQKSIAATELLDGKSLRMHGEAKHIAQGRALAKGIGACFVEVEVDTWTGQFRVTRAVYSHDTGKLVNPFIAISDMEGSFMQSFQIATNAIPYDREFPGQIHSNIAFLSFPIPTFMEFPDEIQQVFIESLEPRWFYGYKSFSETSVGAVPGAIANAIYNATGVRVTHPITAERILMGIKQQRRLT